MTSILLILLASIVAISFIFEYLTKDILSDNSKAKTVSRVSWRYKLICWTISSETVNMKSYCLFFWASWLCVFIVPFTLMAKGVEFITNYFTNSYEKKPKQVDEKANINPNNQDDDKQAKFKEQIQIYTDRLTNFIRPFVWTTVIAAACVTGYFVLKFAFWFFGTVGTNLASIALVDWAISALIVMAIVFMFSAFGRIVNWIKEVNSIKVKSQQVIEQKGPSFIDKLFGLISIPFKAIMGAFSRECPLIVYTDKEEDEEYDIAQNTRGPY